MDCTLCRTEGAINTSLAPAKIQLPFPDTFLVALLLLFYPAPHTLALYFCVASNPLSPVLSSGCFWQQLLRNERAHLFLKLFYSLQRLSENSFTLNGPPTDDPSFRQNELTASL
jgi:hypothetical protein